MKTEILLSDHVCYLWPSTPSAVLEKAVWCRTAQNSSSHQYSGPGRGRARGKGRGRGDPDNRGRRHGLRGNATGLIMAGRQQQTTPNTAGQVSKQSSRNWRFANRLPCSTSGTQLPVQEHTISMKTSPHTTAGTSYSTSNVALNPSHSNIASSCPTASKSGNHCDVSSTQPTVTVASCHPPLRMEAETTENMKEENANAAAAASSEKGESSQNNDSDDPSSSAKELLDFQCSHCGSWSESHRFCLFCNCDFSTNKPNQTRPRTAPLFPTARQTYRKKDMKGYRNSIVSSTKDSVSKTSAATGTTKTMTNPGNTQGGNAQSKRINVNLLASSQNNDSDDPSSSAKELLDVLCSLCGSWSESHRFCLFCSCDFSTIKPKKTRPRTASFYRTVLQTFRKQDTKGYRNSCSTSGTQLPGQEHTISMITSPHTTAGTSNSTSNVAPNPSHINIASSCPTASKSGNSCDVSSTQPTVMAAMTSDANGTQKSRKRSGGKKKPPAKRAPPKRKEPESVLISDSEDEQEESAKQKSTPAAATEDAVAAEGATGEAVNRPQGKRRKNFDSDSDLTKSILIQKNRELEEELLCQICIAEKRRFVFLCGHSLCEECTRSVDDCPFCRQPILKKIKMY